MNQSVVLAWSDELSVGLEEIDDEHRTLVDIVNKLGYQRARYDELELLEVFNELQNYTARHFWHEEELMNCYPISEDHRQIHLKSHNEFINRLNSAEKLIPLDSASVIDHLLAFLVKWLVFHIGRIDAHLAKEIIALRSGVPPDQIIAKKNVLEDGLIKTVSELYDSLGLRTLEMLEINSRLQDEIERRKKDEEALKLAALVYHHAEEAMVITDESNCIIAVNPGFTKITGYTAEEVLGKNPKFMSSGRHDQSFYRELWNSLLKDGHWEGEIWNRRKTGEVYPEWLSINTIHKDDGTILRHLALFSDITKKKEAEDIVKFQANFDSLTLLPNRRLFMDRLEQSVKHANRSKFFTALLFLDLDCFKEVNDAFGHQIGDMVLIEAARRIKESVRDVDTVARLGGDEFTVILSELPEPKGVERVARQIIRKLGEPFTLGEEIISISGSIGIALYPENGTSVESLVKNADQAMYLAKNSGRNCFCFFDSTLL
jgi:diguanylate cyclase (GGDEF)-like protein/hemerythrin-like metal-binding protein/PAS domain S-box-containing protein